MGDVLSPSSAPARPAESKQATSQSQQDAQFSPEVPSVAENVSNPEAQASTNAVGAGNDAVNAALNALPAVEKGAAKAPAVAAAPPQAPASISTGTEPEKDKKATPKNSFEDLKPAEIAQTAVKGIFSGLEELLNGTGLQQLIDALSKLFSGAIEGDKKKPERSQKAEVHEIANYTGLFDPRTGARFEVRDEKLLVNLNPGTQLKMPGRGRAEQEDPDTVKITLDSQETLILKGVTLVKDFQNPAQAGATLFTADKKGVEITLSGKKNGKPISAGELSEKLGIEKKSAKIERKSAKKKK